MRSNSGSGKSQCNAANKISKVINELFLPFADAKNVPLLTEFDNLTYNDQCVVHYVAEQCPEAVQCKSKFVLYCSNLYDRVFRQEK